MKKTTKILSAITLCMLIIVMSMVPAFASSYGYIENHDKVDCANRYVDGSCYKFLIKFSNEYELRHIWVNLLSEDGYEGYVTLNKVSEKPYCSLNFEYEHGGCSYYMLTIDTSNPSIPSSLIHKMGITVYCSYNYKATNNANGELSEGSGYWLSR